MAKRSEAGKTAKADEPWTDKERFLIVQHVLSTANLDNLYDALSDTLVKEGCPVRKKIAYSDQWRRKIMKDILRLYSDKASSSWAGSSSTQKLKE